MCCFYIKFQTARVSWKIRRAGSTGPIFSRHQRLWPGSGYSKCGYLWPPQSLPDLSLLTSDHEAKGRPPVLLCWHGCYLGSPGWLSGIEFACQCRRGWFNPWVENIPWRRKWQSTSVFFFFYVHSSILAWRIPWTERGAWWAPIHGVSKSWTWPSDWAQTQTCKF